jgi:hypothetical protein
MGLFLGREQEREDVRYSIISLKSIKKENDEMWNIHLEEKERWRGPFF